MNFNLLSNSTLSRGLLVLGTALALSACSSGGSSGGDDSGSNNKRTATGTFVDSPVEGIHFKSGGQSGFTDADGHFTYEVGGTVTFSIGDIVLGSATGGAVITPVNLAGAGAQVTDPKVVNILRLLQTLDDDDNPDNGIQITEAVRNLADEAIDFDLDPEDFVADSSIQTLLDSLTAATTAGARDWVDLQAALQHFIDSSSIFAYEGVYTGTFTGDDTGNWSFEIGPDGSLVGNSDDTFLSASLNSDGEFSGTTADGCVFEGTISDNGQVAGVWNCQQTQESGEFTGSSDDVDIQTPSDFSGQWSLVYSETGNNCGDPSEGDIPYVATVTQSGPVATVVVDGENSYAAVEADTLSWYLAYPDGDGVTTESILLTLNGSSVSGTSSWTWVGLVNNDIFECSGTGTITGTCTGGACLP